MDKSPSCELTVTCLVKKFPHRWNTMFHYSVYRSPPLSLTWAMSLHSTQPYVIAKVCLDIASGRFPAGFPNKTLCSPLLSPHTYYTSSSSYSSWFDCPTNIYWGMHIVKLLNIQLTPITIYLVSLRSKCTPLSQHRILELLSLYSSLSFRSQESHI
jgi:hypothetical protein